MNKQSSNPTNQSGEGLYSPRRMRVGRQPPQKLYRGSHGDDPTVLSGVKSSAPGH